jgi:hypothetical protein
VDDGLEQRAGTKRSWPHVAFMAQRGGHNGGEESEASINTMRRNFVAPFA